MSCANDIIAPSTQVRILVSFKPNTMSQAVSEVLSITTLGDDMSGSIINRMGEGTVESG